MTTQLTLLPPAAAAPWQLDDSTRTVGREGLAAAREALAAARLRANDQPVGHDPLANAA